MSISRSAWVETAGLFLALAFAAQAQVSVELLIDQEQFLRDESLPVKVRIVNRSGQTLHFGPLAEWLSFNVEMRDGKLVQKAGELSGGEQFTLESSMIATRLVDLSGPFKFDLPGRYKISAVVKVNDWKEEFASKSKQLEIVRGTKIWEQEFGVPADGGAPEVRKYVLQQAQYHTRLMPYARVAAPAQRYSVRCLPVGRVVSFSSPEAQVDRVNTLHRLFQSGAGSCRYAVCGPSADLLVRQYHEYGSSRPVLRMNDVGNIFVNGGVRRILTDDLPPPAVASTSTNEVSVPKP